MDGWALCCFVVDFYTMTTIEGDELSLTARHFIPVFDEEEVEEERRVKIIRTSQVTLQHQLILFNRTCSIKKIVIENRRGFFSPLTLSGYLMVNNISASIFSDRSVRCLSFLMTIIVLCGLLICSYEASHQSLQGVLLPVRVYYYVMRWCLGSGYDPFASDVKEGLHPVVSLYKRYATGVRVMALFAEEVLPSMVVMLGLVCVRKMFDEVQKKL